MSRVKKLGSPMFGPKVAEFLNIAYKDYLAARVLLNSGLLLQGSILASTAIEKYFKAILAFRGNEARGHLSRKHINAAKNYDKRLSALLNDGFLILLQRAYSLRYLDDLPEEFNIVIAYREFLAELDYTATMIQESFHMQQSGKDAKFSYDTDKENRDPLLHFNKHILHGQSKQEFVAADSQSVFEVRNCKLRGLLEITYLSTASPSDGNFLREGFKANDAACMHYKVSLPIEPASDAA